MGYLAAVALACLAAAAAAAAAAGAPLLTASQCDARGFEAGALACATCAKLERTLRPLGGAVEPVVEDCRACCSATLDALAPVRFGAAELVVCRFSLSAHGGINEFLEKSAWRDAVTVTDVMGAAPTLTLRGAVGGGGAGAGAALNGLAAEPPLRVAVGSWKVEQLESFLALKTTLQPAAPSASPATA